MDVRSRRNPPTLGYAEPSGSRGVPPTVFCEVSRLVSEYFLRTDRPEFGSVAELFKPDGTLELGALILSGSEAIAAFFVERNAQQSVSGRKTRHLCGPLTLRMSSPDVIELYAMVAVFSASGVVPLPSALPSTIVDFDDVCERDLTGVWRFARRKATLIFASAAAPAFAK